MCTPSSVLPASGELITHAEVVRVNPVTARARQIVSCYFASGRVAFGDRSRLLSFAFYNNQK
jgi:hypothetical protein